jgi:Zn-dependent protease with chaperone function
MMHLGMILIAIATAYLIRLVSPPVSYPQRYWDSALSRFVVPPSLLMMTAIAIVIMGPRGSMVPLWEGWVSYLLAWGFIATALGQWLVLGWQALQTQHQLRQYPTQPIQGMTGKVLQTEAVFSAQVGFWQPQLVVSQGLLDSLSEEHLAAVLAHESAHTYYRDTFWFFWLGGLRRLTRWLPQTEALWQELLLLREIRADQRATQSIDPLTLAEALTQVITAPLFANEALVANFSCARPSRLARRIDALLAPEISPKARFGTDFLPWGEVCLSLAPLLTVPFHH